MASLFMVIVTVIERVTRLQAYQTTISTQDRLHRQNSTHVREYHIYNTTVWDEPVYSAFFYIRYYVIFKNYRYMF